MGPVLPCTWPRSGGFESRRVRPSEALTIADATNRPCLGLFGNAFSALVGGALDTKRCSMGGPGDQRVCDSQPPNAALQEDPLVTIGGAIAQVPNGVRWPLLGLSRRWTVDAETTGSA
jgi:hypothetical protein